MQTIRILATLCIAPLFLFGALTVDKAKIESYVRYAEGYMDNVQITMDDPVLSTTPNFYRMLVHLSTSNGARLERIYYITADGKQIVNGSIWDLDHSPFTDRLARLPDKGFAFGPPDAKVKLVIFSDFECPFCREFAKTVRDNVPKKYPKDVRVIFEDYPLEAIHPWARAAAEASHCIGDPNVENFWAFHDWIFEHAAEIKNNELEAKVIAWAADQKLDVASLKSCLDTHEKAAVVSASEARARELMIQQTPTSFANGREIPAALPWKDLDAVIQIELKRLATATPAER